MKKYMVIIPLLFAVIIPGGILLPAPDEPVANTVVMNIDGREHYFTGNTGGAMIDLGNGQVRIVIGVHDPVLGVKMQISADIPEGCKNEELHLDSQYAEITMLYKSRALQFIISPPLRMARDPKTLFFEKKGRASGGKNKRREADWLAMGWDERVASGKGIVRERRMEGSSLFLVIRPVSEGGVREFRGTFSGIATYTGGAKRGRPVVINGGKFRVGVVEQ